MEDYREDCNYYDLEAHRYSRATIVPVKKISSTCYTVDNSKAHKVFLWGDSHVQQLYYGLNKNLPNDWQVLIVASSGCAAGIVENDSSSNYCVKSNFVALDTIKKTKPEVVIIAQNAGHNVAISSAINNKLKEIGVSKVVFLGPVPHWTTDLHKIISRKLWIDTPTRTFVGVDKNLISTNQLLKADFLSKNLTFVDVISVFCDSNGCLTRIGEDKLTGITTHDYGHLLKTSSDYLANKLLVKVVVNP
jgi:hypothetical protein